MAVMVGLWQKFSITTTQVNLCPYPNFTRNQLKIHLIIVIKIFCHRLTITAISWPPPGFHNFFTLAILYRAAGLDHTFYLQLEWLDLSLTQGMKVAGKC